MSKILEIPTSQCASFTGHRLTKAEDRETIVIVLREIIQSLSSQGISTFLSGSAFGFDLVAAESVIYSRDFYNLPIKLIMVSPCKAHEVKWSEENKKYLYMILDKADDVIYLSEQYYDGFMKERNKYLVEHSSICLAYLINSKSGTGQTVRMATAKGLTVYNIKDYI